MIDSIFPRSKALDVNRFDAWAAHAISHCKEMTGKLEDGIKFMGETENDWSVSIYLMPGQLAFHSR